MNLKAILSNIIELTQRWHVVKLNKKLERKKEREKKKEKKNRDEK